MKRIIMFLLSQALFLTGCISMSSTQELRSARQSMLELFEERNEKLAAESASNMRDWQQLSKDVKIWGPKWDNFLKSLTDDELRAWQRFAQACAINDRAGKELAEEIYLKPFPRRI